jgi:hypothetical protein
VVQPAGDGNRARRQARRPYQRVEETRQQGRYFFHLIRTDAAEAP